jgi:hypothetical protein
MRSGLACLILCLGSSLAAAGEAGPLPAYFEASFSIVAAQPLAVYARPVHAGVPVVEPDAVASADLPEIVRSGSAVPTPPVRPVLVPGAAAYASVASVGSIPPLAASPLGDIPLPVRRPADLAKSLAAEDTPADAPPQLSAPETKVAMLGAMPGAGMAIAALARMTPMAPIVKGSCSVGQPYRVTALGPNGRTMLEPAATLDLPMVQELTRWEAEMQDAAKANFGEAVTTIHVAASYDCRTMNHRRRARLSEHAHANAIDISEYETASGRKVTVEKDFYAGGRNGAFLKAVHADTCDLFQVVLGPGSDGMHENHFHMDLGRWKACR